MGCTQARINGSGRPGYDPLPTYGPHTTVTVSLRGVCSSGRGLGFAGAIDLLGKKVEVTLVVAL